jgi:hypothetical protein
MKKKPKHPITYSLKSKACDILMKKYREIKK